MTTFNMKFTNAYAMIVWVDKNISEELREDIIANALDGYDDTGYYIVSYQSDKLKWRDLIMN